MEKQSRLTPEDKAIRKIRKKLREIEHLELLDRELNEEEERKVYRKRDLRQDLQNLVSEHRPDETDVMKRQGVQLGKEGSGNKKPRNIEKSEEEEETQTEEPVFDTRNSSEALVEDVNNAIQSQFDQPSTSNSSPSSSFVDATESSYQQPLPSSETQGNLQVSVKQEFEPETRNSQAKPQTTVGTGSHCNSSERTHQDHLTWKDSLFEVLTLVGHNDIVLDVDCTDELILSASRDTTVRVWKAGKTHEERSLRGHTSSVTSVSFLPDTITSAVLAKFEEDCHGLSPHFQGELSADCRVLAVSGGLDCTLKVWDVLSGESLGSIYTYNGITCLGCGSWGIITGTEGGKLEVWDVTTGERLTSYLAFESQVATLNVTGVEIHAGSIEGELGIWKFDAGTRTLRTVFAMEPESPTFMQLRRLSAIVGSKGKSYIGDNGPNIKVLDYKRNMVSRLANHIGDFGITDSMTVTSDGHLLAASYYVDTGRPCLNVRELATGKYVCSFLDTTEGRFLTISTSSNVVVTGGHLLKVWTRKDKCKPLPKRKNNSSQMIHPCILRKLARQAVDSGSEDDTDLASSSDEEDLRQLAVAHRWPSHSSEAAKAQGWWCRIL